MGILDKALVDYLGLRLGRGDLLSGFRFMTCVVPVLDDVVDIADARVGQA
jgi:hypothetical protein